jgi:hypothetical protein
MNAGLAKPIPRYLVYSKALFVLAPDAAAQGLLVQAIQPVASVIMASWRDDRPRSSAPSKRGPFLLRRTIHDRSFAAPLPFNAMCPPAEMASEYCRLG